jgi:hypothetical protein
MTNSKDQSIEQNYTNIKEYTSTFIIRPFSIKFLVFFSAFNNIRLSEIILHLFYSVFLGLQKFSYKDRFSFNFDFGLGRFYCIFKLLHPKCVLYSVKEPTLLSRKSRLGSRIRSGYGGEGKSQRFCQNSHSRRLVRYK